jgi:hypothetical protein
MFVPLSVIKRLLQQSQARLITAQNQLSPNDDRDVGSQLQGGSVDDELISTRHDATEHDLDWKDINFQSTQARKLSRDFVWGFQLCMKLSLPLILSMVGVCSRFLGTVLE